MKDFLKILYLPVSMMHSPARHSQKDLKHFLQYEKPIKHSTNTSMFSIVSPKFKLAGLCFPGFFRKPGKNQVNPVNPVENYSGFYVQVIMNSLVYVRATKLSSNLFVS